MSQRGVPSNQNNLFERAARAAFLEQPKEAFNGDIDHILDRFLAGRTMNHVGDTVHCFPYRAAISDVSSDGFEPRVRSRNAVMTEGPNGYVLIVLGPQNTASELGADLASGSRYQNVLHRIYRPAVTFVARSQVLSCKCKAYTLSSRAASRTPKNESEVDALSSLRLLDLL